MTLFDVEELTAYWAEHPPMHILMGAYLGAGKRQRSRIPSARSGAGCAAPSDLRGILAELGPGFGTGDIHAGLREVALDFAELRNRANGDDCRAQNARSGKK